MKLSSQIRPIGYLKAHAAEIVRNLAKQQEPLVITQNGKAKVVIQDIRIPGTGLPPIGAAGVRDLRISRDFFKPYRIIYRVIDNNV